MTGGVQEMTGGVFLKTLANNQISTRKGPFYAWFRVFDTPFPMRTARQCASTHTPSRLCGSCQFICWWSLAGASTGPLGDCGTLPVVSSLSYQSRIAH